MRRSAVVARLRREGSWELDAVVAFGFFALAELEIITTSAREGPLGANMALLAVAALALFWRRRRPLASAVVALSAVVAVSAWLTPVPELVSGLLILVIAPYSVAAWSDRRLAIAGLVAGVTAPAVVNAIHGGPGDDYVFTSVVVTVSWFAGRALRGRRLLAAALAERTRRLEAEREDRARLAIADERTRIARELHAVVANSVSTMVVQAEASQRLLDEPDRAEPAIAEIEETGRQALSEMRRILGVLRQESAPERAPQPGIAQAAALVERGRAAGLDVGLRVEGEPGPLPAAIDLAAYRMLEGSLQNVLKHSPGGRAGVLIRYGEADVELKLWSDGPSEGRVDEAEATAMREWMAAVGGEFRAGPGEEGGYEIHARLPLTVPEAVG